MELVVDSLINYSVGEDEELRDISGLGQHPLVINAMDLHATP